MFTRLLSLWVTGALLLLLSCDGESESEDDDLTTTSNYDDYNENSTYEYYTYRNFEVLHDTGDVKNKDSVQVFRHDLILSGLLVFLVCQQT